MSSTRYRAKGAPRPQERWASHPEYERGLLGNLVAKRAAILSTAADRELVYFLQRVSWDEGGIAKLAADLIAQYPERIATVEMQDLRIKPGQTCSAQQVRKIRGGFLSDGFREEFPLRGESGEAENGLSSFSDRDERDWVCVERQKDFPSSYPASVFFERCADAARDGLKTCIEDMCLNPGADIHDAQPWYFPYLLATIREWQAQWIKARAGAVVTEIGNRVNDTLDFSLQGRCLTVVEGIERIGKSFAARQWCDAHPGQARYVEVPAAKDDISFFREIARALGCSVNLNSKAHELRGRVEAVLNEGHLMLVCDEAQLLWPEGRFRETMPYRVQWISHLVNHQIPVALIATPQFFESQRNLKRRLNWRDGQFTGRLSHYEPLPESLPEHDLTALAKLYMPEGDPVAIAALVDYAKSSKKYIAGIEHVVRRARFVAQKQGRERLVRRDIAEALRGSVIPSDSALTRALDTSTKAARAKRQSAPLQEPLTAPEKAEKPSGLGARPNPSEAVIH